MHELLGRVHSSILYDRFFQPASILRGCVSMSHFSLATATAKADGISDVQGGQLSVMDDGIPALC